MIAKRLTRPPTTLGIPGVAMGLLPPGNPPRTTYFSPLHVLGLPAASRSFCNMAVAPFHWGYPRVKHRTSTVPDTHVLVQLKGVLLTAPRPQCARRSNLSLVENHTYRGPTVFQQEAFDPELALFRPSTAPGRSNKYMFRVQRCMGLDTLDCQT